MADDRPPEVRQSWLSRQFPVIVRYAGLAIALYETLIEKADRPALLALAGSMMLGSLAADAVRRG